MSLLKLIETAPGNFSLLLNTGTTPVDGLIKQLGHEPNGYFWEGIAQLLVKADDPALEDRFSYDSEGSMFCAYGEDRAALETLSTLMRTAIEDADRMRQLITTAEANGFEFDD